MNIIEEARQGHRVFRIEFPDGKRVTFRLLSWKQFSVYHELLLKGTIPAHIIEEAIYRECVLGYNDKEYMPEDRAGIVSTVSTLIMNMSGPAKTEHFDTAMGMCRERVDTLNSQIVMIICRAFPAYTPEDIEEMPWSKVLMRLAQAERILMSRNPPELEEPIRLMSEEERQKEKLSKSGRVNTNDLLRESRELSKSINSPPPTERLDLSPKQVEQVKALARRRNKGP